MQCSNPQILEVQSPSGIVYTIATRCRKCYACQCESRGEMAARCRYEMHADYNRSCHFITLTYDDAHLPVIKSPLIDTDYENYLNTLKPYSARRYGYSILRKDHVMQFFQDMNEELKRYLVPQYYYVRRNGSPYNGMVITNRHGYFARTFYDAYAIASKAGYISSPKQLLPKWPEHHTLRYYCSGEYGDISKRAHYHAIIFSPVDLNKQDYMQMIEKCWPYGRFNVGESCQAAACNYVAKHQVKSCMGTALQNSIAPIFMHQSTYLGGIGVSMKDDPELRLRYDNSVINKNPSMAYISNYQRDDKTGKIVEYRVHYPRFLTRSYHPLLYDDDELSDMILQSNKSLKKFFLDNYQLFPTLADNYQISLSCCDFVPETVSGDPRYPMPIEHYENVNHVKKEIYRISRPLLEQDASRRRLYELARKHRKARKLRDGGLDNFNSV